MEMYVLQIKPGCEKSVYRELIKKNFEAFLPKKLEYIRKSGEWRLCEKIVFAQYLFVKCSLTDAVYYTIRSIDGVRRFLGHGRPEPLPIHEECWIEWLDNKGRAIEPSRIFKTANGDKMVLSGILRDWQGDIEYDLRQRKANVFVTIAGERHKVTLPIIAI